MFCEIYTNSDSEGIIPLTVLFSDISFMPDGHGLISSPPASVGMGSGP